MYYLLFFLEIIFPYLAIAFFIAGTIFRLWQWLKKPVPMRIYLAPAQKTWAGVTKKIAAEVLVFISLLRNDRVLWIAVWIMHFSGLGILFGTHTFGIIESYVELFTPYTIPAGKTILFTIATIFSITLVGTLVFIILKRVITPKIRRISLPLDYFALGLILTHVIDGIILTYIIRFNPHEGVKWGIGLITFQPYVIPDSLMFAVHCLTGFGLFLYFPFSKLFHPIGQAVNRWTMTQKEEPLVEKGAVVK